MTAGKPTPGVQPYASAAPAVEVAVAGGEGSQQLIASRPDSSMDAIKSTNDFPPSQELSGTKTAPQQRHESFPEKLFRLLMEVEAKGRDDIISFTLEGDRFEISPKCLKKRYVRSASCSSNNDLRRFFIGIVSHCVQ
jgi:hypothetical protein